VKVQFNPGSVSVLPKTARINEDLNADGARETLRQITRELVSGNGVKSGYLRLHVDKDSPTLSRGGGHVRSGYSAAQSLVEQLVETAYGKDSDAANSLRTYLNGRTKVGTRSLVKLVAAMEGESASDLAPFRTLKNTRLQAPKASAGPSQEMQRQQRLQKAENDLQQAMKPVGTPRRFINLASRGDTPTRQLEAFEQAMDEIDKARQTQQGRLELCRAALDAGAEDPFAHMAQSDAAHIERFFNPDSNLRNAQHEQIKKGLQDNLDPGQIAEQLNLDPGLVADQMLTIQFGEKWDQADQAHQAKSVERLLHVASDDPSNPLYQQAQEVDLLLTSENLQWYATLRAEGMSPDAVKEITPQALRLLAERHARHDPLRSQELPGNVADLKAQMRKELFEEQAEVIWSAGKFGQAANGSELGAYKHAWGEARGQWINLAKEGEQARKFLAQWRNTSPASAAGQSSVVERLIKGRAQEVEQIRQDSIDELLKSIHNQWDERRSSRMAGAAPSSEVLEAELQAFETALAVARSALDVFDAAHETGASHGKRLNNRDLLDDLSGKVGAERGVPVPGDAKAAPVDAKAALADLKAQAGVLRRRRELDTQLSAPAQARLLGDLKQALQRVQRDLAELQETAGPLDADGLQAVAGIHKELRLTQEALVRHAGPLGEIAEDKAEIDFEDDPAQASPTRAQRVTPPSTEAIKPEVAQARAAGSQATRPADLPTRLTQLKRSDPGRHGEYMGLAQKLQDAKLVDQWLDEKSQSDSISPAVLSQLKNGVQQKTDLFGQQMQTLLDSESGRLDGRTRLTPQIREQVLAEDRSKFWRGAEFQPFLAELVADPAGRAMLRGQTSVEGAIDDLTSSGATVEEARKLIESISVSFTQSQAAKVDRAGQGPGAGQGANQGEQVLRRIGGKRIANAGDGHCLFLSFGHFQDPTAAAPGQAGKKPQQDLIRNERQGLLDQALRLSEAQYRLMGTDPRSQDLDKAESVERLLIGLNSDVGTDERGWGWVGHFPLKAMQAQRPVLLISEDGQTRAWGPNGQEIKLSASQASGRSPMGQGQMLLALAKDKAHNPQGAAPIVVFNRHNHFEAVQVS
jgi:hypothetical protein